MRRKQIELEQAVIVAARNWVQRMSPIYSLNATDLVEAVRALDDHNAAEMTGQGAKWVHGSPETSREAAGLAVPAQFSARHHIIKALMNTTTPVGLTDDQLERKIGRSHQTVSSARNWLVEAGWLRDSGFLGLTRSGRKAVCWELTPAALKQIGDI